MQRFKMLFFKSRDPLSPSFPSPPASAFLFLLPASFFLMSYAQFKAAFIALALISFDAAQAQITSNATCLSSWSGVSRLQGQKFVS